MSILITSAQCRFRILTIFSYHNYLIIKRYNQTIFPSKPPIIQSKLSLQLHLSFPLFPRLIIPTQIPTNSTISALRAGHPFGRSKWKGISPEWSGKYALFSLSDPENGWNSLVARRHHQFQLV